MATCKFLLMMALLLLLSSAVDADTTLSGLTLSGKVQAATNAKRSLREGLKAADGAPDEERGVISQLFGKVKAWATKIKAKLNTQPWGELTAKERVKMIKAVAEKKGKNYKELYRENVTPDEYFKAMGFDYRYRFARKEEVATLSWHFPGFKKWDSYEKFYYKQLARAEAKAKAQAEALAKAQAK